ncbi:MAG: response regulator [Xenococcaceae cyanobacterium MO_167.B27]|nr:response regulator [Xenococcaceae cyanobacterium MO_167.B27]
MRILVVDDDDILVDLLSRSLANQNHVIDVAEDGEVGWEYVQTIEYDLILLDVDLPILDGVSLCEKIRSESYKVPILLMTAKDASQDRIRGLDAGADDYLTKPLDLGELNARIRALSRRGEVIPTAVLEVNGLTLDPTSCQVSYQQKLIKLTAKEYSLLELFMRNPSRVFSRSQILDRIWTFDDPPLEDSVKAHIKGLRKKLKKAGIIGWIENVYGIGYRLNAPMVNSTQSLERNQPVSSSVEQEFNQKMEQMWLQYQDKMAERMKVLQNAVNKLQNQELSSDLHYEAERAAHKLAGVLGMFDRETGTAIAKEIETLLENNPVLDSLQQEKFISLVTDLDSLLALDTTLTTDSTTETAKLLLISQDTQLAQELPRLGKSQELGWHQIDSIKKAKTWLQSNSPYLVAIDTETTSQASEYLSLIAELTSRTPAIPTLVLSATDSFSDRVTVARAGAKGFLVKPITSAIIWQTANQLLEQEQSGLPKILIVDDDIVFLSAMRSMLEPWGMKITTLSNPLNFWEVLQATHPDLLILDVEMPEINGIELCQALRGDPDWQELPTLFLTARQDAKTIQQVFEVGGDDYISKPVVDVALLARINNRLDRSRLLHNLATKDTLTGLKNRPQSNRELESLLQQAKISHQPLSLALLRMDELPQINLKYGHEVGDRILQQWGKVIQAAFRNQEVSSYWGNGDFIIGIPNLSKTEAEEHLTEILTILRKQIFTAPDNTRFQVSCSCSVAEFPKDGTTLHSLYQSCYKD